MKTKLTSLFLVLLWTSSIAQDGGADKKAPKQIAIRIQLKPIEYCMGALYNGGFMGLQSGIRLEGYLHDRKVIPEIQYNHGWIDVEKLSFPNDVMRPFSDLKLGVRIGKVQMGKATWKRLHCIDRTVRDGNTITTYYEEEEVYGDRHIGFAGGIYMSRAFINNAFTKESGVEGSISLNVQSIFAGFALTKMLDNKAKEYKSGNVCIWDQYSYYYVNMMYALNHTLGDTYYYGGLPNPVAGSQTYPATPSQEQNLRAFSPFGVIVGYESGRWRRGFVGNFELGVIPSLKGKGAFFKVGASYILGI